MKYDTWKIKTQHHSLSEFDWFLKFLQWIKQIDRIIPWRISRKQSSASWVFITFSYFTDSWLKYNMKKWSTSQELFIVCKVSFKELVYDIIANYIKIL